MYLLVNSNHSCRHVSNVSHKIYNSLLKYLLLEIIIYFTLQLSRIFDVKLAHVPLSFAPPSA
jgi:hypothetical protein